jgi:hypothetical protein
MVLEEFSTEKARVAVELLLEIPYGHLKDAWGKEEKSEEAYIKIIVSQLAGAGN